MARPKELIKVHMDHILFEYDDGTLILSVVCGRAAVFSMNVMLSKRDKAQFEKEGAEFIDMLASNVRFSPGAFTKADKAAQEWMNEYSERNS